MLPEIVKLPRLVGGTTIPHQLLIDKHFNGTKVPCEVARRGISRYAIRLRTSAPGHPARSGFGNSLSRPRPSASRMRLSSLSEYAFPFRLASLCKLYLLSARRYIRSIVAGALRPSRLQQSNDALPSLLHPISESGRILQS